MRSKPFVCSYRFRDRYYTFDIEAKDRAEAEARLKAIYWAKVDGELVMRGPAWLAIIVTPLVFLLSLFKKKTR